MGPPAEREYAVEPVGVDTITPSDWKIEELGLEGPHDVKDTYHCFCEMLSIDKDINSVQMWT